MRQFNIFRYLKKFIALICVIEFVGLFLTNSYIKSHQQYSSFAIIQYTNSEIKNGLTPDGTKLDVNEIYSSSVISQALKLLDSNDALNVIRSRCSVYEIVSDEQKAINEAIIAKGEEVTYFPDTYRVNLVVDNNHGDKYARNALDAILQSYCVYYTEKYVEQRLSLNPSDNLIQNGYEYYQCVDILQDDTESMLEFLKKKKDDYPNFRSTTTGYSFSDLYDIYSHFNNFTVPDLFARVLSGPIVKDGTILRNYLANEIAESKQNNDSNSSENKLIKNLINNFVKKNIGLTQGSIASGDSNLDYVLKQIEERGGGDRAITTYDSLIINLVELNKSISYENIDQAFLSSIAKAFESVPADGNGTAEQKAEMETIINDYEKTLGEYYNIVNDTCKELNSTISSDYLKMVGSIRVYPTLNKTLYFALAFVVFLVLGCLLAIFVGRGEDVVNYMLFIDKKTNLPNRDKLNAYIEKRANVILKEDFTCFSLKLDNIKDLTKRYGYSVGDSVLKDFSDLIALLEFDNDFVGYNGMGCYLAFSEHCSDKKAKNILKILDENVQRYNELNPEYPIVYHAAFATTTTEGEYQIRNLLRAAEKKSNDLAKAEETKPQNTAKTEEDSNKKTEEK